MTTMVTELYDALREAGASEDKARKAAETLANYDRQFTEIRTDLTVLKWGQGVTMAMALAILLRVFLT